MKKALITGAARGLGEKIKDFFIEHHYHVTGTSRRLPDVKHEKNCTLYPLDLTNTESIDNFTSSLIKSNDDFDVIIHNAGVAYLDPVDVLSPDELRKIFEVNYFGPIHLTKKLLPLMKKAKRSNLIFISSIVSIDHWPYLGAYASSKTALETTAFEWAVLLKKWNILVSVLQPNPLPTDMEIQRSINAIHSPYPELANRSLKWESMEDTCRILLEIVNSDSPKFQYQTGEDSKKTAAQFKNLRAYEQALEEYQSTITS